MQIAGMSPDDPLNAYGANFYQGIADDVTDLDELASRALEFMAPAQQDTLRIYLQETLDRFTPSELKGKVNRAIREYGFSSKSAVAFLRATAGQLNRRAQVRFSPVADLPVGGDDAAVSITPDILAQLALPEIDAVAFYKRDEITTDLICCDVEVAGRVWTFHEEAAGWNDLIAHLADLPGFRANWYAEVVHPPFADSETVAYQRR